MWYFAWLIVIQLNAGPDRLRRNWPLAEEACIHMWLVTFLDKYFCPYWYLHEFLTFEYRSTWSVLNIILLKTMYLCYRLLCPSCHLNVWKKTFRIAVWTAKCWLPTILTPRVFVPCVSAVSQIVCMVRPLTRPLLLPCPHPCPAVPAIWVLVQLLVLCVPSTIWNWAPKLDNRM